MAVTKYDDQKHLGEERVNFSLKLIAHYEGNLGGTLLTGLFPVLTQLVYYRPQDLGVTPPAEDWNLPHQPLIEKMPHRLAFRPVFWRCFLR